MVRPRRDNRWIAIITARLLVSLKTAYAAVSLAHQAAEKALKAACWHVRAEEPPWRHDLLPCALLLAERTGPLSEPIEDAIRWLDPLFALSRYPSSNVDEPIPALLFDPTRGEEAIVRAEEVLRWVQQLLQQPPGRPSIRRS